MKEYARQEWERLTTPDPQPGRVGRIQHWRRKGSVRVWLDWETGDPRSFILLNIWRDPDGRPGDARPILQLLKNLCERNGLTITGSVSPQRPEQLGNDALPDIRRLVAYYESLGFQVTGRDGWHPKLRYPPA